MNRKALAVVAGAFFAFVNVVVAQTVTTANSVRTVVYQNGAKAKGQWTLNPKPRLQISGDDGVEILDIATVVRQSDGTVVVASNKTIDLRFFAACGAHLRNVGRQGRGRHRGTDAPDDAFHAPSQGGLGNDTRRKISVV